MKTVTLENYKEAKHYLNIVKITNDILLKQNFISAIDIFKGLGLLSHKDLQDWWNGRVPYLEKVLCCNLNQAGNILRTISFHAHDLDMKRSITIYTKQGKGPKQILRFTKTGETNIEKSYFTHFVNMKKKVKEENLTPSSTGSQDKPATS